MQICIILSLDSFVLCGTLPTNCSHLSFIDYFIIATEIILVIFFAAKDGEALYSQQKQD